MNVYMNHTTSSNIIKQRSTFDRQREWSCGHSLLAGFLPVVGLSLPKEVYVELVNKSGSLLKIVRVVRVILRWFACLPKYKGQEVSVAMEATFTLLCSSQFAFPPESSGK